MKNQTLSKDQMDHLEQLGISIKNASIKVFVSIHGDVLYCSSEHEDLVSVDEDEIYQTYSTFTLYDILKILPRRLYSNYLEIEFDECYFAYYYPTNDYNEYLFLVNFYDFDRIMDGAYEMLIWIIENGYLNLINQKHENI